MTKKLFPLALMAVLAACAYDNHGRAMWGHCDHCDGYAWHPSSLYERNLGAVRGAHHEAFEHNDVVGNGYYYNAPWSDGAAVAPNGAAYDGHHHHWVAHGQPANPPANAPASSSGTGYGY